MEQLIQVSEDARAEFLQLLGGEESYIRLTVIPGGCSGLSYQLSFERVEMPFDLTIFDDKELKILSDELSIQYLKGLSIDYSGDLIQAGFRFNNPNAASACGCGSSFSV